MSYSFSEVIANIFKNRILLAIFVLALIFSFIFPIYGRLNVIPQYNNYILKLSEKEAIKVADFISHNFFKGNKELILEPGQAEIVYKAAKDLGAIKIHIFNSEAKILHSTEKEEIGTVNDSLLASDNVSKGTVVTNLIKKGDKSIEGQTTYLDVAEVYVPWMSDGQYIGATEVYFDITDKLQGISTIVKNAMTIAFLMSFILLILTFFVTYKASVAMLARDKAQKKLKESNDSLNDMVQLQTREIRATQETSIEALAILAEYYDLDTGVHIDRIQTYVRITAEELANNSEYAEYINKHKNYIEEISLASILHDIGKTAIPKEILAKPGKLTDEEFEVMKKHTSIAGEILEKSNDTFIDKFGKDSYLAIARDIALHHHEKWNGNGYPHGLKGTAIPLSARITAVVDVYDALRSKRPYKDEWTHEKASEVLIKDSGSHFDPEVVKIFLRLQDKFDSIYNESIKKA